MNKTFLIEKCICLIRVHLKSQKHVRCETGGFYDVQIVLQNTLNEADGVFLAKPNSRKK